MEYDEYRFRADMLQEKQVQAKKKGIAAACARWVVMKAHGGRQGLNEFLAMAGLYEQEKLSEEEMQETMDTAARIMKRMKGEG